MGQLDDLIVAQKAKKPQVQNTPAPKRGGALDALIAKNPLKLSGGELTAPLMPVLTGAARAAGTGVSKVFDVLNRPHEALTAGLTGGAGEVVPTLMHGQSQESQDEVRQKLRTKLASAPDWMQYAPLIGGAVGVSKNYNKMNHAEQGIADVLLDTAFDPLTYAGGSGIGEHVMEQAGVRGGPAVARALEAASKSANPVLRKAAITIQKGYDYTHYKGQVARTLAAQSGEEGLSQYQGLKAINNARRGKASDLATTLINQYHTVIKGLSDTDEAELYHAVHTGTVAKLPEKLQQRAYSFKQITDSLAHLSSDPELKKEMGTHFTLPKELGRFETEEPRNLQTVEQYRQHYVPTAKEAEAVTPEIKLPEEATTLSQLDPEITKGGTSMESILNKWKEEKGARTTEGLNAKDPNLQRRVADQGMAPNSLQRKIIENRLRGGASAIAATDAERQVAKLFGKNTFGKVPTVAKMFFQETYKNEEDKEFWDHVADGWRSAVDIPKIGLFALPFRHIFNIASLSALADPSIGNVTGTAGRFARLLLAGADPEARAKVLGEGVKFGVTGTPSIDRAAAGGWLGRIPIVGDIYKASNHALWAFDDAAKATRFDKLLKHYKTAGMDEVKAAYKAADDVAAELIDYSNRSPLTQALANVAPFATYRSKLPVAIARSVSRHPERTLIAGRASPELVGDVQDTGTKNAQGTEQVGKSYLPLAETLRVVDNPAEYLRATAGYPLQMGASLLGDLAEQGSGDTNPYIANYATYGKNPDLRYLANSTIGSFPGGETALGLAGQGEFMNQGSLSGALRGQTGFGLTSGPTASEQSAALGIAQFQAAIAAADKAGDTARANQLRKALGYYMMDNHTYQK